MDYFMSKVCTLHDTGRHGGLTKLLSAYAVRFAIHMVMQYSKPSPQMCMWWVYGRVVVWII